PAVFVGPGGGDGFEADLELVAEETGRVGEAMRFVGFNIGALGLHAIEPGAPEEEIGQIVERIASQGFGPIQYGGDPVSDRKDIVGAEIAMDERAAGAIVEIGQEAAPIRRTFDIDNELVPGG